MKKLLADFFHGLIYIVPLAATVYVVVCMVNIADSFFPGIPLVERIPGLGLVLVFIIVTLVGWLGGKVLKPSMVSLFDHTMSRIPFIKLVYTSVRDLMRAFVGEKRKFDRPVVVSLDAAGLNNRLGFVTQDDLAALGLAGMVAVYSPYPYSVMGDLIVVPAVQVRPLEGVNSAELMKLIVSGGISGKDEAKEAGDEDEKK